jgi:hypothetical protein
MRPCNVKQESCKCRGTILKAEIGPNILVLLKSNVVGAKVVLSMEVPRNLIANTRKTYFLRMMARIPPRYEDR